MLSKFAFFIYFIDYRCLICLHALQLIVCIVDCQHMHFIFVYACVVVMDNAHVLQERTHLRAPKFSVGQFVECWSQQQGWQLATIISSRVDVRNRRSYSYTVKWDNTDVLSCTDIPGRKIREAPDFAPTPIDVTPAMPNVMETDHLHNFDENIDPLMRDIVAFGKDISETSIEQTTTPAIKRILTLPLNNKSASALYNKAKVPDLEKILVFRKASIAGLKSDLFARAFPMHSKYHLPAKRKRKGKTEKDQDAMIENCNKRNKKEVGKLFVTWTKTCHKNELVRKLLHIRVLPFPGEHPMEPAPIDVGLPGRHKVHLAYAPVR